MVVRDWSGAAAVHIVLMVATRAKCIALLAHSPTPMVHGQAASGNGQSGWWAAKM